MANDLTGRQWRLDTPIPFGSPGAVLWNSNIAIVQIEFSSGVNCILKDRNGRIVASGPPPDRLGNIGWVNGLCLDTLDSGLCIVYIR